ncbi:BgTH12-07666 [Blumeria graminis f. sp. triticale]|uniref:BgTH12-07666 n=1 Tax=Blumeria graminis f. sp. triticale TaxID=1689686 RepID=A0A9W4D391_BLUGR|nr:BgTH12-07666 [Blumeria graminis f. sp. triticale]
MNFPNSHRPPPPMSTEDYDHEIKLIDRSTSTWPFQPQSTPGLEQIGELSINPSSNLSNPPHHSPFNLREKLTRWKFGRYQDRDSDSSQNISPGDPGTTRPVDIEEDEEARNQDLRKGRPRAQSSRERLESAIDVLYENQRGCFLCGIPLFSSRALGNLDPVPWTNVAQKSSATNITNAQPPDPSWEWAWKEWSIYHTEGINEDGWVYSFAFHGKFSWHKARWWNSFVRKRAWIRKRFHKRIGYECNDSLVAHPEYFTICTSHGLLGEELYNDTTTPSRGKIGYDFKTGNIYEFGVLMKILRSARIDREKIEAVKNFIENGEQQETLYLEKNFQNVMQMFVFQASRRILFAHLLKILKNTPVKQEEATSEEYYNKKSLEQSESLLLAAHHELKKFEFWRYHEEITKNEVAGSATSLSKELREGW